MKKNIFKYILGIISVLILFVFLKTYISSFHLSDNYVLMKNIDKGYSIQKGLLGKNLVNNLTAKAGWVINSQTIYGYLGENNQYFFLNKSTHKVRYFTGLSEFNKYLKLEGLKSYDMSDEEGFVHLKYGKDINRKFNE